MAGKELAFRTLARCLGSLDSRIARVGLGVKLGKNRLCRTVLLPGGAPGRAASSILRCIFWNSGGTR